MAKSPRPSSARKPAPTRERGGRARSAGELVKDVGGVAFKRFGFVQSAVVERWAEIVGERYARVSLPESIRFPGGKREGGTLTLMVDGAHAPLMQHLTPLIVERVNRFFGYGAIDKVAFRQGRVPAAAPRRPRAVAPDQPIPRELGDGLRAIADPELRAVLESLAGKIAASDGPATVEPASDPPIPILRSIKLT